MPSNWKAYLLQGARPGKIFTIPVIPDARATRIYFNGDILFRVANNPLPTQYSISGNTIILGENLGQNDDGWCFVAEATTVITANLVEIRPDFYFNVELRDVQGNLKEVFRRDIDEIDWRYNTNGGCGPCEIGLSRAFDSYGDIGIDYEVKIWRQLNPQGIVGAPLPSVFDPVVELGTTLQGARELRYSGIVRRVEPVFDQNESVKLHCSGFGRQLEYIAVPEREYQNMDIGAVIRDIIDALVIPGTRIQRTNTLGLVPDINQDVTDVFFDTSAAEAISNLADLAGNVEWGVRADKEFYFIPRTTLTRQTHIIGKDVELYISSLNADDVVNRVYLRGFDGYRAVLNFGAYQSGNQKERIIVAPFIGSDEDAALWGTAYQAKFGTAQRTGHLRLAATDKWIERPPQSLIQAADHPLGILRVSGAARFVSRGEPLPDQLNTLLGEVLGATTDHRFRINSIHYTPGEGGLNIDIELGERGSKVADRLITIERKLSELRQIAA